MEGDIIVMQDIFRFVQVGVVDGKVQGYFTATGVRPKFAERIEAAGIPVPASLFTPTQRPLEGRGFRH
jgi:pilus assembly protein CpaF